MDVNILKLVYLELEREIRSIGLSVNEKKCYVYDSINIIVRRRPQNLLVGEKNFEGILVSLI